MLAFDDAFVCRLMTAARAAPRRLRGKWLEALAVAADCPAGASRRRSCFLFAAAALSLLRPFAITRSTD